MNELVVITQKFLMSSHPCVPDPGSSLPHAPAPPNSNNNNNNNNGDIPLNRMQLLCLAAIDPSCLPKASSEEPPFRSRGELESNASAAEDDATCIPSSACTATAATVAHETQEIPSSQWSHFILIMALSPHIAETEIRSALSSSTITKASTESITFWGHVVDAADAHVLVEAVVAGVLPEFGRLMGVVGGGEQSGRQQQQRADDGLVCIRLGSGTVLVWEDSERLTRTVLAKVCVFFKG
ncbi:hypothetical protein HDU78_002392 [Chytriomyces hyalinus]|nr:hypothetical protein HDU78_002392 [Chytriomyces hyalinus]